jgi:fatty-acyl-CoA synthase
VPQIVDRFPMTVTGKIQKFRMREIMVEELGLQGSVRIKAA